MTNMTTFADLYLELAKMHKGNKRMLKMLLKNRARQINRTTATVVQKQSASKV